MNAVKDGRTAVIKGDGLTITAPLRDTVRISWSKGAQIGYRGQTVHGTEEDGRRFWTVLIRTGNRDRDQWRLRQEFSSCEDACRYIDEELDVPGEP